jgi:hypothetical protein
MLAWIACGALILAVARVGAGRQRTEYEHRVAAFFADTLLSERRGPPAAGSSVTVAPTPVSSPGARA